MKKLIFSIFAIMLMVGCNGGDKASKEQTYKYVISKTNGFGETFLGSTSEFKALNDSAAYLLALEIFEDTKEIVESSIVGMEDNKYLQVPTGFILKNKKGEEVIIEGLETEKMKAKREKMLIEQRKVFAGAEFGMSKKQIKSLDYYKDWFRELDYLHKYEIEVGNRKYNGYLFFNDDKLYQMDIVSRSYRTASYYDTTVKDDVENLRAIIESAYGRPTHNYGYPSFLKMKESYTTYAYVWEIGTKRITIGVSEEESGSRYAMRTSIENTEVINEIKKAKEAADKKKVEEASILF